MGIRRESDSFLTKASDETEVVAVFPTDSSER